MGRYGEIWGDLGRYPRAEKRGSRGAASAASASSTAGAASPPLPPLARPYAQAAVARCCGEKSGSLAVTCGEIVGRVRRG